MNYGEQWEQNNKSLEKKRLEALKYLGNNWILKGGQYNPNNHILKKK